MANEIAGSGNVIRGSSRGWASSESVSPVCVSFRFMTTPISPAPRASTFFWVLPWSHDAWPVRSLAPRAGSGRATRRGRSEEHTSELQSPYDLVCRLLLEKKKNKAAVYRMNQLDRQST